MPEYGLREVIPGQRINLQVLSRAEAVRVSPEVPHIYISITDPGSLWAKLADSKFRQGILRLQFHDCDRALPDVVLFSDEQAALIVDFVAGHHDVIELIVCQCDAGMSRSAGVAAGLSKWMNNDAAQIVGRFPLNRFVMQRIEITAAAMGLAANRLYNVGK